MVTKTVDVAEGEPTLSDLLSLARQGVEVLLVQNDTPLARLVPATADGPGRIPGLHPGAIRTSDDFDDWQGAQPRP